MAKTEQPGPEPQWSADGQWWWDGNNWTQMWQPPRGLAWDGQTWVRVHDAPPPPPPFAAVAAPAAPVAAPERPTSPPPPPRNGASPRQVTPGRKRPPRPPRRDAERSPNGNHAETAIADPPRRDQPAQFVLEQPFAAPPRQELAAVATSSPNAYATARRATKRPLWLVAAAVVLIVGGITSVAWVSLSGGGQNTAGSSQASLHTGKLTSLQVAHALPGRRFTRDVVPPELGDAAPLRDVFVAEAVPGLIGETSTTTSDLGGTVTFYVFADPVWAEAFFENPPTAFGCGVCTSMGDATEVSGVGDKAMSYVLYRKQVAGQGWIATTTYVLSGSVVVNGLYFPVNVANPRPSPTDLAVATAYTKAALQLLNKL